MTELSQDLRLILIFQLLLHSFKSLFFCKLRLAFYLKTPGWVAYLFSYYCHSKDALYYRRDYLEIYQSLCGHPLGFRVYYPPVLSCFYLIKPKLNRLGFKNLCCQSCLLVELGLSHGCHHNHHFHILLQWFHHYRHCALWLLPFRRRHKHTKCT